LLDAATFRVHHVELKIDGPSRYGSLAVSMRGEGLEIARDDIGMHWAWKILEDGRGCKND